MPDAPLTPRVGHGIVVADDAVIVWGGFDVAAAGQDVTLVEAELTLASVVPAMASLVPQAEQLRVRHADGSWHWHEIIARNMLAHPAVQAVVKGVLQLAKGKTFKPPEAPPSREPDFGPKQELPKFPGEVIIPGPKFEF